MVLGTDRREVERFAQGRVTDFGQARLASHRGAGITELRIQTGIGRQGPCGREGLNILPQQLGCRQCANAGNTIQQVALLLQLWILFDVIVNLLIEEPEVLL